MKLTTANADLDLASATEAKLALSYQTESAKYYAMILQGVQGDAVAKKYIAVVAIGAAWQMSIIGKSYSQWTVNQINTQLAMGDC